jgi:hypothetical protein
VQFEISDQKQLTSDHLCHDTVQIIWYFFSQRKNITKKKPPTPIPAPLAEHSSDHPNEHPNEHSNDHSIPDGAIKVDKAKHTAEFKGDPFWGDNFDKVDQMLDQLVSNDPQSHGQFFYTPEEEKKVK